MKIISIHQDIVQGYHKITFCIVSSKFFLCFFLNLEDNIILIFSYSHLLIIAKGEVYSKVALELFCSDLPKIFEKTGLGQKKNHFLSQC